MSGMTIRTTNEAAARPGSPDGGVSGDPEAELGRAAEAVREADLILATDLDGTFLGGSDAERRQLYDWIEAHRAKVALIFVTGRDMPFIEQLCGSGDAPWPLYVIGDVGATIAATEPEAGKVSPHPALEAEITERWNASEARVRALLDEAPGLVLQESPFRHRVSYHLTPHEFDEAYVAEIEALGLDCLISDNRYLDVLPPGVQKGPSLLRLLDALDADHDRVLVAGDTLNDLSLMQTGLAGVAVGNSEPALLDAVQGLDRIHCARAHGAGGIAEAIAAHSERDGRFARPLVDALIGEFA